jgi:hypothetical protein
MGVGAVLFSIVTILMGTVAVGDVATPSITPRTKVLVAGHLLLAGSGAVLLVVALLSVRRGTAWVSVAVLVAAATFGVAVLTRARLARRPADSEDGAERPVWLPVVVAHGGAALLTVFFAVLLAVRGTRA